MVARRPSEVTAEALELGYQIPNELLAGLTEATDLFPQPFHRLLCNGLAFVRDPRWRPEAPAGLVARRIGLWERIVHPTEGLVVDAIVQILGPRAPVRTLQDGLDAYAQLQGPGAPWDAGAAPEAVARTVLLQLGVLPASTPQEDGDGYQQAPPSGSFGAARLASEWELAAPSDPQ